MRTFNIYDEKWIPVIRIDGSESMESLRSIIMEAHEIKSMSCSDGLQNTAIIRLIIAFIARSYNVNHNGFNDESWYELWDEHKFDIRVFDDYVNGTLSSDAWNDGSIACVHDRMWLIDDTCPFMQATDMESVSGEISGLDAIMQTVRDKRKTNNYNVLFGNRKPESYESMSFDEALRYILATYCYDTSAQKQKMKGVNPNNLNKQGRVMAKKPLAASGTILIPTGSSMFETIMLNLPFDASEHRISLNGVPLWEQEPLTADYSIDEKQPDGIIDAFTFPSRRIRLIPNDCNDCIKGLLISAGDNIRTTGSQMYEPMMAFKKIKGKNGAPDYMSPFTLPQGTSIWRGIGQFIVKDSKSNNSIPTVIRFIRELLNNGVIQSNDYMLNATACTVYYGSMEAVVNDIYVDDVHVSNELTDGNAQAIICLNDCISKMNKIAEAYGKFAVDVAIANGLNDDRDMNNGDGRCAAVKSNAKTEYYAVMEPILHQIIQNMELLMNPMNSFKSATRMTINNLVNSKKDDIVKLTGRTIIKDNVEKRYSFDKAEGFLLNKMKKEL